MTRKGYLHLVASFREAREAAEAAHSIAYHCKDGDHKQCATCDCECHMIPPTENKLIVRLPRGVRLRTVQEAAVEAGLTAARAYAGGFFLHLPVTEFQMELAREILFSKGIDSDIRKP